MLRWAWHGGSGGGAGRMGGGSGRDGLPQGGLQLQGELINCLRGGGCRATPAESLQEMGIDCVSASYVDLIVR